MMPTLRDHSNKYNVHAEYDVFCDVPSIVLQLNLCRRNKRNYTFYDHVKYPVITYTKTTNSYNEIQSMSSLCAFNLAGKDKTLRKRKQFLAGRLICGVSIQDLFLALISLGLALKHLRYFRYSALNSLLLSVLHKCKFGKYMCTIFANS